MREFNQHSGKMPTDIGSSSALDRVVPAAERLAELPIPSIKYSLYSEVSLYTIGRCRLQCRLLRAHVLCLRDAFNEKLSVLKGEKKDTLVKVVEMLARLEEVGTQLRNLSVEGLLKQEMPKVMRAKYLALMDDGMDKEAAAAAAAEYTASHVPDEAAVQAWIEQTAALDVVQIESLPQGPPHQMETPTDLLKVAEAELTSKKVYSAEEIARQDDIRRQQAVAKGGEGNKDAKRALWDMMRGSLEGRDSNSVREIPMPVGLAYLESERSDAEKVEVAAYVTAVGALEDNHIKNHKSLSAEARHLRTSILDTSSAFDQKLQDMLQLRVDTQMQLKAFELLSCMLSRHALYMRDTCSARGRRSTAMSELDSLRVSAQTRLSSAESLLKQVTQRVQLLRNGDKAFDKAARKEIVELSESQSQRLTKLFKQRPTPTEAVATVSAQFPDLLSNADHTPQYTQEGGAPQDPFEPILLTFPAELAAPSALYYHDQRPPVGRCLPPPEAVKCTLLACSTFPAGEGRGVGLTDEVWDRILFLRAAKIVFDIQIYEISQFHRSIASYIEHLTAETRRLDAACAEATLLDSDSAKREFLTTLDIPIVSMLTEGQVSLRPDLFLADSSEHLLLNKSYIDGLNEQLRQLGSVQVQHLESLAHSRQGIAVSLHRQDLLRWQIEDTRSQIQDVHIIRVVRDMHAAIKSDISAQEKHKKETAQAEARLRHIEYQAKQERQKYAARLAEVPKKMKTLQRQTKELRQRTLAAQQMNESREMGLALTQPAEEAQRANRQKIKRVAELRRLRELSKVQSDEILFLQAELLKLRKRTYPNFDNNQDDYPDEQY
ncbi:hypothetical protein KIPB_001351 [Kipferlia bialata]|uniref:Uncharacterized protein n=1 Tax=Kipferlia bialata TaxID=797122 RepID=A0A9K3CPZ0_9EUKA|nr:hypothetical protein KIPB_001351 [Kipferlia bialata]|eukprot:g1351.t1